MDYNLKAEHYTTQNLVKNGMVGWRLNEVLCRFSTTLNTSQTSDNKQDRVKVAIFYFYLLLTDILHQESIESNFHFCTKSNWCNAIFLSPHNTQDWHFKQSVKMIVQYQKYESYGETYQKHLYVPKSNQMKIPRSTTIMGPNIG